MERSVTVRVSVLEGSVFLKRTGAATLVEGAPALAFSGSSSAFAAEVCLIDLPDNISFDAVGDATCRLKLASHVEGAISTDPVIMPFLISQRSVSNKGYPIQKVVAHAVNAPRLSQLVQGEPWETILVFVDMCGFQEADFLMHSEALQTTVAQDGVMLEDLWEHSVFHHSMPKRSEWHPLNLPFYIRGGVRVRMQAMIPSEVAFDAQSLQILPRERQDVATWEAAMNDADSAETRAHLIATMPSALSTYYMNDSTTASKLQSALHAYIDTARAPYARVDGWEAHAPYAPAWSHFVVPQYMTSTGMEMPAGPLAVGLIFPEGHDSLEAFFSACIDDVCEQQNIEHDVFEAAMRHIYTVYRRRRKRGFQTDYASKTASASSDPGLRLESSHIDLLTSIVDTVFSETTCSMNYTTDTVSVLGRDSVGGKYRRVLDKLVKDGGMEVERITVDLLRCVGFDCEDGSMFHYRLHMLLCASRFVYRDPRVAAFAHVMDLYMPCVSKMQCGGNPLTGSANSLVCHILSWLILRDEAHRLMLRGVEVSPDVRSGRLKKRTAVYAADRTAYMQRGLYERVTRTADLLTPETAPTSDGARFYPLPVTLCLEPTAPVPCQQMPCAAHYTDTQRDALRALKRDHAARSVNISSIQSKLRSVPVPFPVTSAYPDESHSVEDARSEPFEHPYSPFYRGVLSFWMPDSGFLLAVRRMQAAPRATTTSTSAATCIVDYVCAVIDTSSAAVERVRVGAPHNLFVTMNTPQEQRDGQQIAFIPTAPFSNSLVDAMARLVADEKCPESPIHTGAPVYSSGRESRRIGASRMPGIRRVATDTDSSAKRSALVLENMYHTVRMIPADMNLFYEQDVAGILQRELANGNAAAVHVFANRVGTPMARRVLPLIPEQISHRICTEVITVDADVSSTHDRLAELCGKHIRDIAADSRHPKHGVMQSILGEQWREYATAGEMQETLVRAVTQYILDHTSVLRYAVVVHM